MTDLASELLSSVSFVFFDLDDTLLDHRRAEKAALDDLFRAVVELQDFRTQRNLHETYHSVNTEVWIQYSEGIIDKSEARTLRFARLLQHVDVSDIDLVEYLSERYLELYSTHWAFIPGARDIFLEIAGRCPVGILTNGFAEVQRQKLSQFQDLTDHSHTVVISEDVGFMKPDRRIFEHAAKISGTDSDQILYIGDSYRSDVIGGKNAGWRVAWYQRDAKSVQTGTDADLIFTDWSEFKS